MRLVFVDGIDYSTILGHLMCSTSVQFYSTKLAAQSAMSFVCPDIIIAGMGYWPTYCVLVLCGQTAPGHYYLQYTSKCLCMGVKSDDTL